MQPLRVHQHYLTIKNQHKNYGSYLSALSRQPTIHGVLKDAIRCIRELTLDGNQVKLDELAMFSIGLMTKPANSAKEFMASKNIVGYRLRARATGEFTKKELALSAMAKEDNEYSVDKEGE